MEVCIRHASHVWFSAPWEDCLNSPTKELTAEGLELGDLTLIHSLIYNYKGKLLEMLQVRRWRGKLGRSK